MREIRALRILEFPAIRDRLASQCQTALSRSNALELTPDFDEPKVWSFWIKRGKPTTFSEPPHHLRSMAWQIVAIPSSEQLKVECLVVRSCTRSELHLVRFEQ